ncbi:MAG: putative portal protein [Prokaryotic dsDNA virus sp.]|nr:MAG: putative portal protein [Prokaryotic dsDNA virus sp.]|tara:strand:+ start:8320 stop:10149 length:1830 start_codon:yes stop_codon:yes gene_type:complete
MDKNRLLQVYLEQQTAPRVMENASNDWISYGDGEYKNLYPQFLIDMYNSSATHSAIVNATASMVAGKDIVIEDEGADLSTFVQLKKFLASVNRTGDSAHQIITKCAFDLKLFGSYAINVIWSKDKTKIAEIYHIPVEQIRIGKKNDSGEVEEYYVSSDWSRYRQKEYAPRIVKAYDTQDRTEASQIIYCGIYSPGMEVYHTPDYLSSMNWILTDHLTSEYHLSNIKNGFHPSFWINFNNGVPTTEERYKIEQQIKDKFTGVNSGRFVLTFSDDKNNAPDLQPIQVSDADKQYTVLNELCIQNIMIGHRVTSPMLLGVKTEGQLGGRDELSTAFELYSNTVVNPMKDLALKGLRMVLNVNNLNLPISLSEVSPLSSMFDADVLKDVLTQDEIREQLGYEPLAQAEEVNSRFSEESALDHFLANYGEDEDLENWDLIDEEDASDEHEDFDFAYNLEKMYFARTGTSKAERKSEQDGIDRDINLYRVRYVYATKGGHTSEREFCKKMVAANKVYRKEDIIGQAHSLSSIRANPDLAGNDSGIYNIWKFKGGANCHHRWYRRIYQTKFGNRPNLEDDTIITTTKARSKGFRPVPNEQEVPVAPIDMPNKGYKN